MAFKLPNTIPQDLLLIRELVDVPKSDIQQSKTEDEDSIGSSESEDGLSEEEIEADLKAVVDEDAPNLKPVPEPSDSSSELSTESDISDDSDNELPDEKNVLNQDFCDDEDAMPTPASNTYFHTKHEVVECDIVIPDIDQVGANEVLEKVGDIMTVIDQTAIVRGLPSQILDRRSERALDVDTLLVFDDRKVMGYIYETFGPTAQPLYQVKFNKVYPLPQERVVLGREVFHIPARSRFVFLKQINALKGSDASNVHDEEPAEDELEFSDDEAEATYRSRLKRKRGESRARSAVSSRQATPNPSHLHDQELENTAIMSRNPYDANGPYDVDYSLPGPSRPTPTPYDDPYSDEYNAPESLSRERDRSSADNTGRVTASGFTRGRIRHNWDISKSRGSGSGHGDRGRRRNSSFSHAGQTRAHGKTDGSALLPERSREVNDPHALHLPRSPSSTSLAITRATEQPLPSVSNTPMRDFDASALEYDPYQSQQPNQQSNPGHAFYQSHVQTQFVQPHINPRFASAFGLDIGSVQPYQYPTNDYGPVHYNGLLTDQYLSQDWADQFAVPAFWPNHETGEDTDNSAF